MARARALREAAIKAAGERVEAMLLESPLPSIQEAIARSGIDAVTFRWRFPDLIARLRATRTRCRAQKAAEKLAALERALRTEIANMRREGQKPAPGTLWERLGRSTFDYWQLKEVLGKILAEEVHENGAG
jgi:hypothetical protein